MILREKNPVSCNLARICSFMKTKKIGPNIFYACCSPSSIKVVKTQYLDQFPQILKAKLVYISLYYGRFHHILEELFKYF